MNLFLKLFWTAFNEQHQIHSPQARNTKLNLLSFFFLFSFLFFFFLFFTNARGCYDGFKSAQTLSANEWVNKMTMTAETRVAAVKMTSWGKLKRIEHDDCLLSSELT